MSRPQVMARVAAFLCVAAAILSGCRNKDIARVNASRITRDQLAMQLEEDYGHEVLSRMIDRLLVDQAFQQAELQFPQERLESVIQDWRDQAGSEEEFQRALAFQGRTEEDLRQAIEMGMKMELLGQKDLTYTEADLKKHYEENQLFYDEPERVAFSEIVVQTKKEAEDIHKMATKPGAKFPDLAKQYSIAVSRTDGGQRPLGGRDDILPLEVRDVAFALSKGDISKPFEATELWYIIKIDDRRQARKLSFEEVRERVEEDFKRERGVQPQDLMQQLRSSADVLINDPAYVDMQIMYRGERLLDQVPGGPPAQGMQPPAGAPAPPVEGPPAKPGDQPAEQPETGGQGGS